MIGLSFRSDAIPMLFGHTLPSLLFGLYIVTDVFWCFDFHDFWLVFMIFQGVFMVFLGFWLFFVVCQGIFMAFICLFYFQVYFFAKHHDPCF